MRRSLILIVVGLLLAAGGLYIGLTDTHLTVQLRQLGVPLTSLRVDCGSPFARKYPTLTGLDFGAKGPCGVQSNLNQKLIGSILAIAAGAGCVLMGGAELIRIRRRRLS